MNIVYNFGNVDDLDCMSVDVHGRPSDETRYMLGNGRANDGYFNQVLIENFKLKII